LNVAIALAGALWAIEIFRKNEITLPRLPTEWPMLAFVGVALVSCALSYAAHTTVRTGLRWEMIRVWVFTLVNSFMAFYLPTLFTTPLFKSQRKISIWSDIWLVALWAFGWFFFQSMKSRAPQMLFENLWDFYGAILWILAGIYMVLRTKNGDALEFFHVIFAVTLLAGLYGVLQYFGRDMIWASLVQPYGGRPVSTFGNPNFLSSYLMLVAPLAFVFALKAEKSESWGYLLITFVAIVSVLCTLTRSSYVGLFAGFLSLGVFLFKKENTAWLKRLALVIGIFIGLVLIFPHTPLMTVQSPLARFTEIFHAMRSHESYGPWHQRLLIWSSAWDMVKERPLFGKGWGAFELFYPFYQGKYLLTDLFPQWRTHANNAHNIVMEMWAQLGFAGVGVSLWLFATLFIGGWTVFRKKADTLSRAVTAALLAGLVAMVTDNFFGNVSIFFAMPAYLFWWNMGAMFNEEEGAARVIRPTTGVVRAGAALFIVFCAAVGVYFTRRWMQEVYYFQGFKEARAGMIVPSIKTLETGYAWFPAEVNADYELGNSYARHARDLAEKNLPEEAKKFTDKALASYRAALDANPGYDEIYFNLGISHLQLNQTDDAIRCLETAIFINPLLREAYAALGNQYLAKGEPDKAIHLFEQGIQAFPQDKDMWNNMGFAYTKKNDNEKAFAAYKRSYQLDPSNQQSWGNMKLVAQLLGRQEPLIEFPDRLREMQQAVGRKDFAAARRPAERMVELLPESPDAHLALANIRFYLRDTPGSVAEFQEAIRLRPGFVAAYVNLGHVQQFANNKEEAIASFQQALKLDPSNQEAKTALNQLLSH
jgi:tetratricopeptide (TPR) repeat protein/O-antigen ligase